MTGDHPHPSATDYLPYLKSEMDGCSVWVPSRIPDGVAFLFFMPHIASIIPGWTLLIEWPFLATASDPIHVPRNAEPKSRLKKFGRWSEED